MEVCACVLCTACEVSLMQLCQFMDICKRWHQGKSFRERPCENLNLVFDQWHRHMEIRKWIHNAKSNIPNFVRSWSWGKIIENNIMEKHCGKNSLYFSNMQTIFINTETHSMKKKPSGITIVKLPECYEHAVQHWSPFICLPWAEQKKDIQL